MTVGDDAALRPRTLDDLIGRAIGDMAAGGDGERYVVLTPARLRPYVERRALELLREHPAGRPGATVEVHSPSSLVRSVVGNHADNDRPVRSVTGLFVLRAGLARRMRHDTTDAFREAGDVFGSIGQYADQLVELANTGVTGTDVGSFDSQRLKAVGRLMGYVGEDFGPDPVLVGGGAVNAMDWVEQLGGRLHVYLYGFEDPAPAEARLLDVMRRHAHVTAVAEDGYRSDVMAAVLGEEPVGDGSVELAGGKPSDGNYQVLPGLMFEHADDGHASDRFHAFSALDETAELMAAAALVRDLLKGGTPSSEILVTSRDLAPYRAMLGAVFSRRGISINAVPVATLADQPLAVFLSDLMDARLYAELPDAGVVLRLYRTGLIRADEYRVEPDELDALDARLRAEDPAWVWKDTRDKTTGHAVHAIRAMVRLAGPVFAPEWRYRAKKTTVREALGAMVRCLDALGVRIIPVRDDGVDGRAESAKLVWRVLMGQFDELAERFGDLPFADFRPTFRDNLMTLLASMPAGGLPPASNAVDVTGFPTPMRPYRHVIVLGCTETGLPAVPRETGLLDDRERLALAGLLEHEGRRVEAACLRARSVHGMARREILAFNRVLHDAGEVTFLCPRSTAGTAQALSRLVSRLLPGVPDEKYADYNREHPDKPRTRPRTIDDLPDGNANETSRNADGSDNGSAESGRDDSWLVARDRSGITSETALSLFTKPGRGRRPVIDVSVSTIETYYSNPFEFFLTKGLGLQENDPFGLTPAIRGSFYHAVLQRAVGVTIALDRLRRKAGETVDEAEALRGVPADYLNTDGTGKDLRALIGLLSDLEYEPVPFDGLEIPMISLLRENPEFRVLQSGNRMKAVHEQLVSDLRLFATRLQATFEDWEKNLLIDGKPAGGLTVAAEYTERQFGDIGRTKGAWEPITHVIEVPDGDGKARAVTVRIRGKVDRIDTVSCGMPGGSGSFVIDYKSSNHTLFPKGDGSKVYYGRELQLLTYAYAVLHHTERDHTADSPAQAPRSVIGMAFMPIAVSDWVKAKPADMHIHESAAGDGGRMALFGGEPSDADSIEMSLPDKIADIRDMGCLVGPWSARPKPEGKSRGSVTSLPTAVVEPGELDGLLDYVQALIKDACSRILMGDLRVNPYLKTKDDGTTEDGTKYSDFKDIMALDLIDGLAWRYETPRTLDDLEHEAGQHASTAHDGITDGNGEEQ
ncbi:PD-(D/E)XK nuclease family protein [Bifidobacterium sp. SO4]|uniref:PD-(D/E)XK nuclease family protein n=1 Tax=Bifidobacterium sp. SO4 TaxID=2809030 RepID=UPI001BDD6069|nr:PD-(D/E)XK nuclease family protein [Bifidobacterium sp. SO4]MBT1171231.1 PD-(D/E)XK nuclease family protein [Bifidobacterium sp. SO4]